MKTLSEKNLKKTTRTLYNFTGVKDQMFDTTTSSTGTDTTNTTTVLTTTTHFK